jgi:hypothetical protein
LTTGVRKLQTAWQEKRVIDQTHWREKVCCLEKCLSVPSLRRPHQRPYRRREKAVVLVRKLTQATIQGLPRRCSHLPLEQDSTDDYDQGETAGLPTYAP